jgi:hypothetical protein
MTPIHPNRTQSSVLAAPARRRSTPLGGTMAILTVQRCATDDIGCDLLTGPDAGRDRCACVAGQRRRTSWHIWAPEGLRAADAPARLLRALPACRPPRDQALEATVAGRRAAQHPKARRPHGTSPTLVTADGDPCGGPRSGVSKTARAVRVRSSAGKHHERGHPGVPVSRTAVPNTILTIPWPCPHLGRAALSTQSTHPINE